MIKAARGPLGVDSGSRPRSQESAVVPIINVMNNKGSALGGQGGSLHVAVRFPFAFLLWAETQ